MNADEQIVPTLHTAPADFVAELSAAAYGVALKYANGNSWPDLQLDLWHALTDAANKWNVETVHQC